MATIIDCPIWGAGYEATLDEVWINFQGKLDIDREDLIISERAGGPYRLTRQAFAAMWRLEERGKALLTTWLVDKRWKKKIEVPLVTDDILKSFESTGVEQTLSVPERAERLLHYIVCQTDIAGANVSVNEDTHAAYAWSESTNWEEVECLLDYLHREKGWLGGARSGEVMVTGDGRAHIRELSSKG